MPNESTAVPNTVRTAKDTVSAIDALAGVMARSRNFVVNRAIEQYLETNSWQIERIKLGMTAARTGQVRPMSDAFAAIAGEHGWPG